MNCISLHKLSHMQTRGQTYGKRRKYDELLTENSPRLSVRRGRRKQILGERISIGSKLKTKERLQPKRTDNADSLGSLGKCFNLLKPEASSFNETLRRPRVKRGTKCIDLYEYSELE